MVLARETYTGFHLPLVSSILRTRQLLPKWPTTSRLDCEDSCIEHARCGVIDEGSVEQSPNPEGDTDPAYLHQTPVSSKD